MIIKATEKDRNFLIEKILWQYNRTSKHNVSKKELSMVKKELQKLTLGKLVTRFNVCMGSTLNECCLKGLF